MSNSITNQNQFEGQDQLDAAYGSCLRNNTAFTAESVGGVFPIMEPHHHHHALAASGSEMSHTRHLMDLLGAAANGSNHHHHHHHHHQQQQTPQALSLSLGSHMILPSQDEYGRHNNSRSFIHGFINPNSYFIPGQDSRAVENNNNLTSDYYFNNNAANTTIASSSASFGSESFAALIGNSKYLKPVQSLLEDLVVVGGNVVDRMNDKYVEKLFHGGRNSSRTLSSQLRNNINGTSVLSPEKHEHQIKIAKLISLLEEVEGRYEKYYHQMEEVVASFEMIAGEGAAKCYTALALQAMGRHFCNLRDAIMSQINSEKKKLFQDLPKLNTGLSRLSLFDRDTRQQQNRMSLQQLGMIQSQRSQQQQVWRPIRGLPETSVAILRSWLFEHFLHPYPNDSEKLMLASQTGLTKNQVSNWFINARVRLWKPMIEEMYEQEFGDSSEDSNPPQTTNFTTEDAATTTTTTTHCHHHDST